MKLVYVHVAGFGKCGIDRTIDLGNGVHIDVNEEKGIVGVELINAGQMTQEAI